MTMIQKVKKTIDRYQMFDEGDTVVIALSGGADSCALLSIMASLQREYHIKLIVAHFNHGLRGTESDVEEDFCHRLAQKYDVIFESEKLLSAIIPKGESPEAYYRNERYRFLKITASKHQAKKVALGHHLNDQAETILLNILRGSGLNGLHGILPVRDKRFVRPLIDVSRTEILAYLREKRLDYCHDSSNQNVEFLRNRIRLELIPFLKERFNPQIERGLARMAQMVRRDHEYLNMSVHQLLESDKIQLKEEYTSFSADFFVQLPEALRFRLIKTLLEELIRNGKGIYSSHIHSIVDLVQDKGTGKQISLPFGLTAIKQYDNILIKKIKKADTKDYQYSLSIPGTIDLKERGIIITARKGRINEIDYSSKNEIYLDMDALNGPLILRNRRPGDWFEPLGTNGRKKIKKLFIDQKIPRPERSNMVLLTDDTSVLWVESMHLCNRVKITHKTNQVLILRIDKSD